MQKLYCRLHNKGRRYIFDMILIYIVRLGPKGKGMQYMRYYMLEALGY